MYWEFAVSGVEAMADANVKREKFRADAVRGGLNKPYVYGRSHH